jgi:hypothetical protein
MTVNFTMNIAVRAVQNDIKAALAEVAAKHGISFDFGGYNYSTDSATLKLVCTNLSSTGEAVPKHRLDFKQSAMFFGLVEADLGTTISYRNETYALDGLAPTRPKRPIVMKIIAKRPVKVQA